MSSGSGAHVNQVVRGVQQVLVVFHAEDGVPGVPQTEKSRQKKGHFIEVEAAGRFVKNEEGALAVLRQFPGRGLGQLRGYFDALGFPAGEGVCPAVRGREEKNSAASSTVSASAWAMDFPFQVTSSVSRL